MKDKEPPNWKEVTKLEVNSKTNLTRKSKKLCKNLEKLNNKDSFGLENVPVIKL